MSGTEMLWSMIVTGVCGSGAKVESRSINLEAVANRGVMLGQALKARIAVVFDDSGDPVVAKVVTDCMEEPPPGSVVLILADVLEKNFSADQSRTIGGRLIDLDDGLEVQKS